MPIILGIDPGAVQSGWVKWDTANGLLSCGNSPNKDVAQLINNKINWTVLAIETIRGYGQVAGNDTYDTCIWIGRFDPDCTAMLIPRKDIKRSLCNNTTTNDKYVRLAICDRFGGEKVAIGNKKNPGPLYGITGHMWAALATALTAADKLEGGVL